MPTSAPSGPARLDVPQGASGPFRHRSGCLVCGAPLRYLTPPEPHACAICATRGQADACCEAGHYVCDPCHRNDALAIIEQLCRGAQETDLVALFDRIRQHPAIADHGPEHHALVPAVVVTVYRNLTGKFGDEDIRTAIRRGSAVPGGFCGFAGGCGAALGIGIAFAILMGSTPRKPHLRQTVQRVTGAVLEELARKPQARCCQRDGWVALRKAAELSRTLLDTELRADAPLRCQQSDRNKVCAKQICPLFPS